MTPTLSSSLNQPTGESKATEASQYTVGHRQMAAIGFIAIVALGFVATMAYVAGRIVQSDRSQPSVAAAASTPVAPVPNKPVRQAESKPLAGVGLPVQHGPKVEQLIVVEPAVRTAAAVTAAKAPAPAVAAPPPVAVAPKPLPAAPVASDTGSLTGKTYWQVAAVDRGMAEVSREFLSRKGFTARVGDASSPGTYRVLVGPLRTEAETADVKAKLETEGFKPFLRRY